MKLGVLTVLLGDLSLDETPRYLKSLGVQQVEIGCGGTPGTAHADAVQFMEHPELIDQFMETINKYGLDIAALACHGNPVHPNKEIANAYHEQFEAAICLAEKIGVKTSPAARATAKIPSTQTGPSPAGRRISRRSATGSGTRSSFPIGKRKPNLRRSTA